MLYSPPFSIMSHHHIDIIQRCINNVTIAIQQYKKCLG